MVLKTLWGLPLTATARGKLRRGSGSWRICLAPPPAGPPWVVGSLALADDEIGKSDCAQPLCIELYRRAKRESVIPAMFAVAASSCG